MDQLQKKEVVQAVLIAEKFNEAFSPIADTTNASLLPLVNVPVLDYALEALNRSGVEEVFVYCSTFIDHVKRHIKQRIASKCSWSIDMVVQVIGCEGCRCMGDVLRDLDAKALIRGHFILMNADTVTNANLMPILEEHKRICKSDKGTAMTVVYKKTVPDIRTGDEVAIALQENNGRLLFHQRITALHKERYFSFPLELFIINSEVSLEHDLIDPQIAICAPSALCLFTDNFDFETRDDFVRGLLINEEILGSTIYVKQLASEQYAARISNWQTYQLVSDDIINRWVYPLVPEMGICSLTLSYVYLRNNIYRNKAVQLARGSVLQENVVIQNGCTVDDGSVISFSVVGKGCRVGKNCILEHAFLMENVIVEDGCELRNCVIGNNVKLSKGVVIVEGAVLGENVVLPEACKIVRHFVQSEKPFDDEGSIQFSPKAFSIPDKEVDETVEVDDMDEVEVLTDLVRMSKLEVNCASSVYSFSSDDDDMREPSPVEEDSTIFYNEVVDSLTRGFGDKSNPDFLILEINSSRYAYNMTLSEVKFYVVKSVLNLPAIYKNAANVRQTLVLALRYLTPVLRNYIKGDEDSEECLNAVEECCQANAELLKCSEVVVHFFYDQDFLSEEVIVEWHTDLADGAPLKTLLDRYIKWLQVNNDDSDSESESD